MENDVLQELEADGLYLFWYMTGFIIICIKFNTPNFPRFSPGDQSNFTEIVDVSKKPLLTV